jgi:uncharacterized membrane protein YdcZ (DUF606 family)
MDHRLTAKKIAYEELGKFCFSFALGMFILTTWLFVHHNITDHATGVWRVPASFEFPWWAWIPAGLSWLHLLFGFIKRELGRPTHAIIGFIGKVLSAILMGIFYYLLFTPVVLLTRFFGKDLIQHGSQSPHWEEVPEEVNNPKQIEKLF